MSSNPEQPTLKRSVTGPLLVLYGVGTMIGAGIYALIGEVTATAGLYTPMAFLLASAIAGLTAASFAELSSRFPEAAGEAAYVSAGFGTVRIAMLVGLLIVASGIVSSGVMFRGFVGYASSLAQFEPWHVYVLLAVVVGTVAAWGVAESIAAIAIITVVEAGAIIFVIVLAAFSDVSLPPVSLPFGPAATTGILGGAVLAFYAFIGFEDMVNMAEEVREPRRTVPRSIIIAMIITATIYIALSVVAVQTVPIDELAQSSAPMTLIVSRLSDMPSGWMSYVALVAVMNGALVQVVMAARVLYGLSRQHLLHPWFGIVHSRRQTPVNATVVVVAAVLLSALLLPLSTLAQFTSLFLLIVFTLVNIALIRLKSGEGDPQSSFAVPVVIPWLGAISAAIFAFIAAFQIIG
jgi:amino acid transporter